MTEEELLEKHYNIKPYVENENISRKLLKLEKIRERDKKRVELRIDDKTVILVDKKDATDEYREEWKRRMGWDK